MNIERGLRDDGGYGYDLLLLVLLLSSSMMPSPKLPSPMMLSKIQRDREN